MTNVGAAVLMVSIWSRFDAQQIKLAPGRFDHRSREVLVVRAACSQGGHGRLGLQVFRFRGHEVRAVEGQDRLSAPHGVPLRDAHLLDSACNAGNYVGDAAIVEGYLAGGFQNSRQVDVQYGRQSHIGKLVGLQLQQFTTLPLMYQCRKCDDGLLIASRVLWTIATNAKGSDAQSERA